MNRRELLGRSLSVLALPLVAPLINTGRARLLGAALGAGHAAEYSVRALDLVNQSNVVDMLGLLTLNWPRLYGWQREPETFTETDFQKLRASGIDIFHPAVAFEAAGVYDVTKRWFAGWNRLIAKHPQWFVRIDTAADLALARSGQKIGIVLGMQDANHLRSLADLDDFYREGQRLTQLTYDGPNGLGSGCRSVSDHGLTEFGAGVVQRMNSLGMAIDVSHCGQRTTLDAIEASTRPVLITHANCKALAASPRCKTDEAIRAAARKGGVMGLTGVRHFVRAADPVTMNDALDHFDHVVSVAGIEHVGIGSDTDLDGRDHGAAHQYDIAGLNNCHRIFSLVEGLISRGYTDEHIRLVVGGNFARVLGQIWV